MIKDIVLTIPLVDQSRDVKDKEWKKKSCAICSVKMVIGFNNKRHLDLNIGQLIHEAREMGGYLDGIGWKHKTITDLARKYGVKFNFIKKFPKTLKEKSGWLKKLEKSVIDGKPAMVS